nr:MAG TPA: hypothetical protein [Bacteriophage sp.]
MAVVGLKSGMSVGCNHQMGGVSIISDTLFGVCREPFPTLAI